MYGNTSGTTLKNMSTRPLITSIAAGPPPLYGTSRMSMPAAPLNISVTRCGTEPVDTSAHVVLAATPGLTTSTIGLSLTRITGTRSVRGSYGSDGYRLRATVTGPGVAIAIV